MLNHNNHTLTAINFFPGPGVGKSTLALGLTHIMKKNGYNVEFVSEVAKEFVYDKRGDMFFEQDFILAEQHRRLRSLLKGGVEYAVMDGPLLLSHFYTGVNFPEEFHKWVDIVFNSFTNINLVVERKHSYNPHGRNETEEQSNKVNENIVAYLDGHGVEYTTVDSTIFASDLFELVKEKIDANTKE